MIIKTNEKGYNYKYTDLAGVNKTLEELGYSYQQETRTSEFGEDYIWTRIFDKDGKVIIDWSRGAKVVQATLSGKSNPAQEYGSSLTYARRYSLYMILGIATEDDDAKSLDGKQAIQKDNQVKMATENATEEQITVIKNMLTELNGMNNLDKDLTNFNKKNLSELTKQEADLYIKILQKRKANAGI